MNVSHFDQYPPSYLQHCIFSLTVSVYVLLLCQEKDLGDEYGWKQVHGDVFRPASNAMLFSALVGTGYHISIVSLCVITFAIVGELYTE